MEKLKNICVVTGTRAEYSLLTPLLKRIEAEEQYVLQLVVTGTHLSPEFGMTVEQIEADGYAIARKIEMLVSSDSSVGVAKSVGLATLSFADAFDSLSPDLVIILGDRFEMLAVAQTALLLNIPIAHIHGGELSYGAYDDAIRHAITKMATWHFPSSERHRQRIIQLGENPNRVWNVGALGVENIMNVPLLTRDELTKTVPFARQPFFLITYHPETNYNRGGIDVLLDALTPYLNDYAFIFTKSNADNGGRMINEEIARYVKHHDRTALYDSLGLVRYLSAVREAAVVIGNSSSGLIEVPYLQTPTVNIGERQAGRERPSSVLQAELSIASIRATIDQALTYDGPYERLFGDGTTSNQMMEQLKQIDEFRVVKEFYE